MATRSKKSGKKKWTGSSPKDASSGTELELLAATLDLVREIIYVAFQAKEATKVGFRFCGGPDGQEILSLGIDADAFANLHVPDRRVRKLIGRACEWMSVTRSEQRRLAVTDERTKALTCEQKSWSSVVAGFHIQSSRRVRRALVGLCKALIPPVGMAVRIDGTPLPERRPQRPACGIASTRRSLRCARRSWRRGGQERRN